MHLQKIISFLVFIHKNNHFNAENTMLIWFKPY